MKQAIYVTPFDYPKTKEEAIDKLKKIPKSLKICVDFFRDWRLATDFIKLAKIPRGIDECNICFLPHDICEDNYMLLQFISMADILERKKVGKNYYWKIKGE